VYHLQVRKAADLNIQENGRFAWHGLIFTDKDKLCQDDRVWFFYEYPIPLDTGMVLLYSMSEAASMITPTDLILVCVLPGPRDLEIARLLGWYRIPFRTAPKVVAVDSLAFYQPGTFGEAAGRIDFLAPVRGHELTTRAELLRDEPDHPHAREEYFKLQLGPLEKLAHPILADKWRRLTFLYTTGEYLLNAQTLNDLVVQSDERQILWQSLRERAANQQLYKTDLPEADLPPEVLMALLGIKEVSEGYDVSDGPEAGW
jgi:hypothetical protein